MKKIVFISMLSLSVTSITGCSSNSDEIEVKNDFTNADFVKSQLVGRWNYWGHKSPSCGNCWVYSGDIYKWYFEFSSDGTYKSKALGANVQEGTYFITPATSEYNSILNLHYKDGSKDRTRKIILRNLEGKTATIYENSFEERYEKQ